MISIAETAKRTRLSFTEVSNLIYLDDLPSVRHDLIYVMVDEDELAAWSMSKRLKCGSQWPTFNEIMINRGYWRA